MRRLLVGAVTLLVGFGGTTIPTRSAGTVAVQPGSSLQFDNSFCTMNWVYAGSGGSTYVGAAGHCTTGVNQEVQLASGSLGSPVETIGRVAFVSQALDYCLIKLEGVPWSQAMAGHPNIPTGVSTPDTAKLGDLVQFSGHGVGFDLTAITQQGRVGIFNFFDSSGNQYVVGPVTPGDSGGPVADVSDGNKALGIVDTVGVAVAAPSVNVGEEGVAVWALLADAHNHFDPNLRLVTV